MASNQRIFQAKKKEEKKKKKPQKRQKRQGAPGKLPLPHPRVLSSCPLTRAMSWVPGLVSAVLAPHVSGLTLLPLPPPASGGLRPQR